MEPQPQSPIEMGLTPLADLAYQPLYVGKPAIYLYTANGIRVDRELAALSIQLRLAEALEGTKGTKRLARLAVSAGNKELFCQHIARPADDWAGELRVQETEDRPGIGAIVTVEYSEAEQLFYLGTSWQQVLYAQRQEGGLQS